MPKEVFNFQYLGIFIFVIYSMQGPNENHMCDVSSLY